jgi:class 3 adenylate cyclase/tetratricopeptide (TPR) repeat protein
MGDHGNEAATYLSASLLRAVAAHPTRGLPWCDEVDGTMVMADLSGFTSLSERLASLGDEGAERLTGIINSFFARMLETASRFGGDTITFGGDAILLLFDGSDHAGRAVAASLAMLKQVQRAAAVDSGDGKARIGMSVGAHSAPILLAAAGLREERALSFVLGRDAELTALAEAQAAHGQLAISASTLRLLPDDTKVTKSGDYWRVDAFAAEAAPQASAGPFALTDRQLRRLAPFLPPYARTAGRSNGGRAQLTPEHRRTVVVFVDILGLNQIIQSAGVGAALAQLQAYSIMLTRLAARHHGFVVSSDIATRGSKLVVAFGSPVAHEYAPANAARFAIDLTAELRASGLDLQHKIGMNGGHVFAGEVGPPFRRQYTVMGDAVNLAARLMAAAEPGSTLVSRKLLDHAGPTLCARELEPIKVKGKEHAVAVCVLEEERAWGSQVRGAAFSGREQVRLLGRQAELIVIRQSWEQARGGDGQFVLIEGDAGVGKTRLIDEALKGLARPGRITRVACFEHLQAAPFTPWVDALYSVLGLSRASATRERTEAVRTYLEACLPESLELGSLLNPLLTLSIAQSDVVGSLDSGARRQRLFGLVSRILTEAAGERGHVVVIEDIHWIDDSSLALVRHLGGPGAGARVLLLLTTRPTETPLDLAGAGERRIELTELTESESLEMIREALGLKDLPEEVGGAIYAKTRGNPLFLEEVVRSLQAPGVLERILDASSVSRAAELAALEIPDRVQGLLMSCIDRLPPDTREVLKAGSVVGRSFSEEVLSALDDQRLQPVSLDRAFDELLVSGLVVPSEEDGPSLTFRHALVQDVAYESLPFARRRHLHHEVARYLESTQPSPDHAVLVHHYDRAGDAPRTRFHAVRASESSVTVAANLEAIDYLDIALGTVRGRTTADACLRSRLEELAGDSLETLSRHNEAIRHFLTARRRWASAAVRRSAADVLRELSPVDDAEARDSLLCWKIAASAERGPSSYRRALRWLDMGMAALPPERTGLAGRLLITKSFCLYRLGRLQDSLRLGEEGLALARQEGDLDLQAYASTIRSLTLYQLGLLEDAIAAAKEGVALYEEAGDLLGQARSHNNLAASYQLTGDLQQAIDHMELSLALYARVAHADGVAIQHANLAAVFLDMGEIEEAVRHLEETLAFQGQSECPPGLIGWSFVLLAKARLLAGDLEAGRLALIEGREILENAKTEALLLDADVIDAELRLAEGDAVQAERICRKVISEAKSTGAEPTEGEALRVLGLVQVAKGAPEAAVAELEACIGLAKKGGADFLLAQALAALAEARAECGGGDEGACEDALAEAMRLFRRMGARHDLEQAEALRARLRQSRPTMRGAG